VGERGQNLAQNRAGRIENRQQWQQNRGQRANEVRHQCNETPIRDFWSDHPVWGAWAITRPFRWATWGMLDNWVGYGSQPVYYNYGESTYYQDGAVYSGDQQVATEEEYAQQAEELAASAPETPPENMEWMSLGVFALTQDGQATGTQPTLYMQLVISKEGVISGTFDNKTSGESQTLEGMVDKESQRAAWGVQGKERPIIETGISNLTQDSAPALIHFADGQTQQWLLVRLEEPNQ
jgi:hypothetical protein